MNKPVDPSLDDNCFREDLLRSYLGRYGSRFASLQSTGNTTLCTDPYPILVIQLHISLGSKSWTVSLAEYIEIEPEDPYHGIFDHYQIEIIAIPIEDPHGAKKMEVAVAKSFLVGTQL
jgi:hypothetical protein